MGLWHDLRALDAVEARLSEYRAGMNDEGAATGDPVVRERASSDSHTTHTEYVDASGSWHEYRAIVSEPISTGAADAAVRDWDEPFAEDAPLVDYAGDDAAAESLVREFVEPPFEAYGAWGDIGVCTGCGACGRIFTHHRTNLNDPFTSWCGEYR